MKHWFAVNLFLIALVGVAAGILWLFGTILNYFEPWGIVIVVAGVLALLLTGWIMARVHRWLERWVNRRAH